jgi:hypothetical protein
MNRRSAAVLNWRNRTKLKLMEYKGGVCEKCGYNKKIPSAYHFHHENPDEKEFGICSKSLSFEKLKIEVDKCILVCAVCHAEIHWELQQEKRKFRHETVVDIVLERIDCLNCNVNFKPIDSTQRYCTNKCAKEHQRRVVRPTKEILEKLLNENTWVAVGKMYGVSDNAVRKWVKSYDKKRTVKRNCS